MPKTSFYLDAISEKDNIKTAKILRDFWVKRKQRRQKFQRYSSLISTNLKSVMKPWKALPDMLNFHYTRILKKTR
jgi:hypothetical protein